MKKKKHFKTWYKLTYKMKSLLVWPDNRYPEDGEKNSGRSVCTSPHCLLLFVRYCIFSLVLGCFSFHVICVPVPREATTNLWVSRCTIGSISSRARVNEPAFKHPKRLDPREERKSGLGVLGRVAFLQLQHNTQKFDHLTIHYPIRLQE